MSNEPNKLTPDELKVWDTYVAAATSGMLSSGMMVDGCRSISPQMYATFTVTLADTLIESRRQRESTTPPPP